MAGQTVNVTNTGDCGTLGCGSLRAAILEINTMPGSGTIDLTAVADTTMLTAPLPAITQPVLIQKAGGGVTLSGGGLGQVLVSASAPVTLDLQPDPSAGVKRRAAPVESGHSWGAGGDLQHSLRPGSKAGVQLSTAGEKAHQYL